MDVELQSDIKKENEINKIIHLNNSQTSNIKNETTDYTLVENENFDENYENTDDDENMHDDLEDENDDDDDFGGKEVPEHLDDMITPSKNRRNLGLVNMSPESPPSPTGLRSGKKVRYGTPFKPQSRDEIKKITNSESTIIYHPLPSDDPMKRKPDISKAKSMLGWEPSIQLKEGIEKTVDYFMKKML